MKATEAQKLRGTIAQKLVRMVRLNRTRIDYLQEFQKMIDEYNSGASNIEQWFVVQHDRDMPVEDGDIKKQARGRRRRQFEFERESRFIGRRPETGKIDVR